MNKYLGNKIKRVNFVNYLDKNSALLFNDAIIYADTFYTFLGYHKNRHFKC
jgi:hypothetical protein